MRFVIPSFFDSNAESKSARKAAAQRLQEVVQAIRDHRERLRPLLPPALQRLQELDIHDSGMKALRIDPQQKTMELYLNCGNLQQGYYGLYLHYEDVSLTAQEISLLCLVAHQSNAEIDRNEIDLDVRVDPPQFIHRILWNTRVETGRDEYASRIFTLSPEIELRFGNLTLEITPHEPNWPFPPCEEITVVRDSDKIEGMEDLLPPFATGLTLYQVGDAGR